MSDQAPLPDFELPATGSQRFQLSAFAGHPFVLYFYPRDDTPGCTVEGTQFRDLHAEFRKAGIAVFGISRDLKTMYGRQVRAIERSTFVIDRKGRIAKEWRGVRVPGHAQAVLDYAKASGL